MTKRTFSMTDICARHCEDMQWLRQNSDINAGRWGPQHISEDTQFVLVEETPQSVGTFYVYRSTDGEVTVQVGGQAEPIIGVQGD